MTATCRSCGRLADAEAYFCPACGGDIAIKTESRREPATDYTLKGAAFFAPAAASTADLANPRFRPSPGEANPASVPVELVVAHVIAGLVGLYFVLTNLRALPQAVRFAFEDLVFGGLNLTSIALLLVVGGGFLYSILPLKEGEPFGRLILLTLSAATVASLIRASWGSFNSLTPAQELVVLGCVALAGLLLFSPNLNAHLASEGAGAGEVPDSVRGARTIMLVFAGLSAMVALGLLPMMTFGWQQPMLGIVVLVTAGIAASLTRQIVLGDSLVRTKLSAAVVACYGAALFSDISPYSRTYFLAAGAGSLTVLWLGNSSRRFFGDAPISYPSLLGGAMGFLKVAGGGMRAMNQLTSNWPASAEPQVPLRLAEVGPGGYGEERECPSLGMAIAAKTFLPYSWDLEPPREGYVVTVQLTAPPAMDLTRLEEQAEQGFSGTSTLTLGSSGLLGVGVRGKSHAGEIDPKGTVIAWALPNQTVSEIRVVVDESDQEVVVLDLRSGGQVKMRKPRLLTGDSWENVALTEFVAALRATVKRGSVVRPAPRPAVAASGSYSVPAATPITPKGLVDEYLSTLKRFADFSSRSGRREFWVFTLINGVISFLLTIGWYASLAASLAASIEGEGGAASFYLVSALWVGFTLITFVPAMAVGVRRLHDTGRSGLLFLLALIPFVGLVLIYFATLPSDPGDNLYGPMPN